MVGHDLVNGQRADIALEANQELVDQDHCHGGKETARQGNSNSNGLPWITTDSAANCVDGDELQNGNEAASLNSNGIYDVDPNTYSDLSIQELEISAVNWMSPQYQADFDWVSHLPALTFGSGQSGVSGFPFLHQIGEPGQQVSWDPLAESCEEPIRPTTACPLMTQPPRQEDHAQPDLSASPEETTAESILSKSSTEGSYYVEGAAARAPFKGCSVWRRSILNVRALSVASMSSRGTGSQLEREIPGFSKGELLSAQVYKTMRRKIEAKSYMQFLHLDTSKFPSLIQSQWFFRLYFRCFHPVYPFLQSSAVAYEESADQWIVVLSIIAVGSRYARGSPCHQTRELLFSVLRKALSHQEGNPYSQDSAEERISPYAGARSDYADLPTIQAATLNLVCMLHCGKREVIRRALVERLHLVEACRQLELLATVPVVPDKDGCPEGGDLVQRWLTSQSKIRTGLMIWVSSRPQPSSWMIFYISDSLTLSSCWTLCLCLSLGVRPC